MAWAFSVGKQRQGWQSRLRGILQACLQEPACWIGVLYAVGLRSASVALTGDEKVYISTAMEMRQTGSWLLPMLLGETSYFKPPFQYWMTLLSWKVLGFGLAGTYLPSILALTGTTFFLGRLQRLLFPQGAARSLAGVWFAGCFGTLTYGTSVQMEIWIVFFHTLMALLFCQFLVSTRRWPWFYALMTVAGVSAWVKSPLYSVFALASVWGYLLTCKRVGGQGLSLRWLLRHPHFWVGQLLSLGVGLSWFAVAFRLDGVRFWHQYFATETWSKRGGNGSSALGMWCYFLTLSAPFSLLLFLPGLAWLRSRLSPPSRSLARKLPGVLASGPDQGGELPEGMLVRAEAPEQQQGGLRFLAAFLTPPALFFSIFPYRTETYLYILLPFLALGMDHACQALIQQGNGIALWGVRLNGALLLGLGLIAGGVFWQAGLVAWPLLLLWLAWLGCLGWSSWRGNWPVLASSTVGLMIAVRWAALALGEADLRTLREVVEASPPDAQVYYYDEGRNIWHEIGLLSVALGRPGLRVFSVQEAQVLLDQPGSSARVVFNASQADRVADLLQRSAQLQAIPWKRWKRAFALPSAHHLSHLSDRTQPDWEQTHQRVYQIVMRR